MRTIVPRGMPAYAHKRASWVVEVEKGERYGRLVVTRTRRTYPTAEKSVSCRCDCGNEREVIVGNLLHGIVKTCGLECTLRRKPKPPKPPKPLKPPRDPDDIGYSGAHIRIATQRGRAKDQRCAECGEPAAEWSYRHGSPHERVADSGTHAGKVYSPRPEDYDPLCKTCSATSSGGLLVSRWARSRSIPPAICPWCVRAPTGAHLHASSSPLGRTAGATVATRPGSRLADAT